MRFKSWGSVAATAFLALSPARANQQQAIAVVNGEIIDGNGGTPIKDGVVLVRGGRIVAVGPTGAVEIPGDARVISAAGKSVLPGLADMHVHLTGGGMARPSKCSGFNGT